jgi:4-aminobutyrate aminotransferase
MSAATQSPVKFPKLVTSLPGPNARAIVEKDHQFVSPSYTRPYPLVIKRGWGAIIEDVDGNCFLDFNAGVAVLATGHAHPEIVRAIAEQAADFVHIAGADYYYSHLADLAEKLQTETPGDFPKRVHFGNSGAEAVETALKVAMHARRRQKFIAFFGSFHGRTLGALSLTASKSAQRNGFGRAALDVTHIPYANCTRCAYGKKPETCNVECVKVIEDRLFKTTVPADEVAAIVVEAIQGEGGYVVPPAKFHHELRRIADENDIVLIVDEVQSGMGRTGKMFAIEHFDVVPDVLCTAKGIASGVPLSATVAKADLMNWKPGAHASTFGGNPVAIAASLKTFELLRKEYLQNATDMGERMIAGLRELQAKYPKSIVDVRGLGLMIGVEFVTDSTPLHPAVELRNQIELECFHRGLIVLGAGDSSIRFSPPLVIDAEQVDCALKIFDESIAAALAKQ